MSGFGFTATGFILTAGGFCFGCNCAPGSPGGIRCDKYTVVVSGLTGCAAGINGVPVVVCPVFSIVPIDGVNRMVKTYTGCNGHVSAIYSPAQYGTTPQVVVDDPAIGTPPGPAYGARALFIASGDNVVVDTSTGIVTATGQDSFEDSGYTYDGCRYWTTF